jgi:hypothetical protein
MRFETDLFADQKSNPFLHRWTETVDLKGVVVKRETAATIHFIEEFLPPRQISEENI